jgi:hypothetical protein
MFGSDVMGLWYSYLHNGSNSYRTFPLGSNISNGFASAQVTRSHHASLMNIASTTHLHKFASIPPNDWIDMAATSIFEANEINFPVNFNNPFDIPGHIAGGTGSSSYGPDTRKLKGSISAKRTVDAAGNTTRIDLLSKLEFEVKDAVDFCPGDRGGGMEQILTIPASRLEASGLAHDVGFTVNLMLLPITKVITGADLAGIPGSSSTLPTDRLGRGVSSSTDLPTDRRHRGDRLGGGVRRE